MNDKKTCTDSDLNIVHGIHLKLSAYQFALTQKAPFHSCTKYISHGRPKFIGKYEHRHEFIVWLGITAEGTQYMLKKPV